MLNIYWEEFSWRSRDAVSLRKPCFWDLRLTFELSLKLATSATQRTYLLWPSAASCQLRSGFQRAKALPSAWADTGWSHLQFCSNILQTTLGGGCGCDGNHWTARLKHQLLQETVESDFFAAHLWHHSIAITWELWSTTEIHYSNSWSNLDNIPRGKRNPRLKTAPAEQAALSTPPRAGSYGWRTKHGEPPPVTQGKHTVNSAALLTSRLWALFSLHIYLLFSSINQEFQNRQQGRQGGRNAHLQCVYAPFQCDCH